MRRIGLLCISLPFGRIVNSIGLGQVMLTQSIVHAAASKVELLNLDKGASKGAYILKIEYPDKHISSISFDNQ
jgi:hypothetical protein